MNLCLSKPKINSTLLQDCISCMAWFYFCIHRYMVVGNRAVPDIVVTFSTTCKSTVVLHKNFTDSFFVFGHYRTILSWRSDTKFRANGLLPESFKERSSGIANRVRSNRASKEPDSSTRPGMSLLVATQTLASLSHVKLIVYSIVDTSIIL